MEKENNYFISWRSGFGVVLSVYDDAVTPEEIRQLYKSQNNAVREVKEISNAEAGSLLQYYRQYFINSNDAEEIRKSIQD